MADENVDHISTAINVHKNFSLLYYNTFFLFFFSKTLHQCLFLAKKTTKNIICILSLTLSDYINRWIYFFFAAAATAN